MDFVGIKRINHRNILQKENKTNKQETIIKPADTGSFKGTSAALECLANSNQHFVKQNAGFYKDIHATNHEENKQHAELISILAEMTNIYGENRFSTRMIREFNNLPSEQLRRVVKLSEMENATGLPRFEVFEIRELIKLDEKQFKKIPQLAAINDSEGQPLLDGLQICTLSKMSEKKSDALLSLAKIKDEYGKQIFSSFDILLFAGLSMPQLLQIPRLAGIKTIEGDFMFSPDEIRELSKHSDDKIEVVLLTINDIPQKQKFYAKDVVNWANGLTKEQLLKIPKLAKIKNSDGKARFNMSEIVELAKLTDKEFEVFEKLSNIDFLDAIALINANRRIDLLSFSQRQTLLKQIETLCDKYKDNKSVLQLFNLDEIQQKFFKNAVSATSPIQVSSEKKVKFFKQAIAINNEKTLSAIQNMSKIIEKYGATGFPLVYKRQHFIKDLKKNLNRLPKTQKSKILQKLEIKFTKDNSGYNGLLNIYNLDGNNAAEKAVKNLCEKFLLKNFVHTGDKNVDIILNSLIQGLPEFVNIIGKKQHATHKYTLDTHIIKVLHEALNNPKFSELSTPDKICLQIAIILHDIGKKEGIEDAGHEYISARYANDILKKFNLPSSMKDRIVEIIKNHNWWEQLQKHAITPEDVAVMYRHPADLAIAEIFTEADLKGVSELFYNVCIENFETKMPDCKAALNKFYQGGNVLFTTKIINPNKIPTQIFNGHKYKVLDFSIIPDDADLYDYGLNIHKKSDFKALFHAGDFQTVKKLSNPLNEGLLSTTLVCAEGNTTFTSADTGLMLDAENVNIINSRNATQFSQRQRNFKNFVNFTLGNNQQFRFEQRKIFLNILKPKYNLREEQYGKLYEKLMDKNFITQIKDVTIDGVTIKKEDIVKAYGEFEKYMMQHTDTNYNEINIYEPKIKGILAKVNDLSDIPQDTLQFAEENNLPIFILGNSSFSWYEKDFFYDF